MVTNTARWWMMIILLGGILTACQQFQPSFNYEYRFNEVFPTEAPRTATAIPARMPTTPFPTRESVPLLAATVAAPLAAVEAQTMQLFAQTVPAVASIDVEFSHPSVDGSAPMRPMLLSQGSGFLYDDQGHIVTNAHVVSDQSEYLVRFGQSKAYTATVIGRDSASDIAVLAIAEPIDVAPLMLSQRPPTTGMWVMAIGNPLGLRDSMSLGVVSAVGRTLEGSGQYRIPDIIQVDAAINRGSSGGVLIDSSGAVLGITTAIQSASGNFEGIGYAIPAHQLKRIVPVLIAQGYYQHAWLGVRMQDNNPQDPDGVYVSAVVADGPAGRGGIEAGDVIIGINTNDIRDISDLERTLAGVTVGTLLEITVQRQGTQRMIRVEAGVRPD